VLSTRYVVCGRSRLKKKQQQQGFDTVWRIEECRYMSQAFGSRLRMKQHVINVVLFMEEVGYDAAIGSSVTFLLLGLIYGLMLFRMLLLLAFKIVVCAASLIRYQMMHTFGSQTELNFFQFVLKRYMAVILGFIEDVINGDD
ncbi:hypothetical protein Tco_1471740, partial [Tanacetum coccineum]